MQTKGHDIKLFLYLSSVFVLFTIIGTVSHEIGHYTVAKYNGFEAKLHYASTSYEYPNPDVPVRNYPIANTLGGPLQTMITGTLGLILLFMYRKRYYAASKLNFNQWLIIFISLFWLRESFNLLIAFLIYLSKGQFPTSGDEFEIADYYGLHPLSLALPLGIIGCSVLLLVLFKFVPPQQWLTFVVSGIVGGLFGFYFWLYLVGPILMP